MSELSLEAKIEAVLFFRGEAVSMKKLAESVGATAEEVLPALEALSKSLETRGIVVVRNGDEVGLGTSPAASALIEKITKEELTRDLGKAGLETLSIILYKAPVSRREIDYIRGVNSQFILRNLLIRGLIERQPHPEDQRSFVYVPTIELVKFMGIKDLSELPEYEAMRNETEIAATEQTTESAPDSATKEGSNHNEAATP